MTNQVIRHRIKNLKLELNELKKAQCESSIAQPIKREYKMIREIQVGKFLLEYRDNVLFNMITLIFSIVISWPLTLTGYPIESALLLMLMNFLAIYLIVSYSIQLNQAMDRRSLIFWFVSEIGGNLPEWYQYRSKIRRQLVIMGIFFWVWAFAYANLIPIPSVFVYFGLFLVFKALCSEAKESEIDLLNDAYRLAKLVTDNDEELRTSKL